MKRSIKKLEFIEMIKNDDEIRKIIEYKRQGKTNREINEMPDIKSTIVQINNIISKALDYDIITKEEIVEAKMKINKEKKKKQIQEDPEIPLIIQYFKENRTFKDIASMPNIHNKDERKISEYIGLLKELGLITKEDIQEVEQIKQNKIEEKEKQIKEKVEKADIESIRKNIEKLLNNKEITTTIEKITSVTGKENTNKIRIKSLLESTQFQKIISYAEQEIMVKDIVKLPDIKKSKTTIFRYINIAVELGLLETEKLNINKIERAKKERDERKERDLKVKQILERKKTMELIRGRMQKQKEESDFIIIIPNEQKEEQTKKSEHHIDEKNSEIEQKIKKLNSLKREIDLDVRLNKTPSSEKQQKIREYINLCNEIYQNNKISLSEIEFLRRAMYKVAIEGKDLARFVKRCCDIERYGEALKLVMNRADLDMNCTDNEEESFKNIQSHLLRIYRIQEATRFNKKRK